MESVGKTDIVFFAPGVGKESQVRLGPGHTILALRIPAGGLDGEKRLLIESGVPDSVEIFIFENRP